MNEMYKKKYSALINPLTTFYISRFWRLYPVFIVSTVLAIVVSHFMPEGSIKLTDYSDWQQLLIPGYMGLDYRWLEPGWSLDIEFQFYLLLPFIFAALNTPSKFSNWILLSFGFGAMVLVFGFSSSLPKFSAFFVFGVLISKFDWKATKRLNCYSVLSIFGIFGLVYALAGTSIAASGQVFLYRTNVTDFVDIGIATLAIPFVSRNVRTRDSRIGQLAGNISFPFYLVHWITLGPYVAWYGGLPLSTRIPWFLLYLIITMAISLVVYFAVDRPFESMRKSWVEKKLVA